MIRLDTTARKLTAVLDGGTTGVHYAVTYNDRTASAFGPGATALSTSNGTTPVDILAAPGAATVREVDAITVRNTSGSARTVTVKLDASGTGYELVSVSVAAGGTLQYTHGAGWFVFSATGGGGGGTVTSVNLTAPAAGITVSGGPVTSSGSITLALADDLAAVEGLAATGLAARTGASTWAVRTLTAPAAGITVSNGDGVSGNPTLALANDLAALEALSGTNTIYYRSGTDTWSAVTIGSGLTFSLGTLSASGGGGGTVTSVGISGANGIGVSGSPVISSGTIALSLGAITPTSVVATTSDSGTTNAPSVVTASHSTSGTPAAGFGTQVSLTAQSTATTGRALGNLKMQWADATDASRRSVGYLTAFNTATLIETEYNCLRWGASSGGAPQIGFLNAAPIGAQTGDVATALLSYGLMTGTVTYASASLTGRAVNNVLHFQDQKASGTSGGTSTAGSWQTHTLNTTVVDTGGISTLVSNQVSLPAGTYRVRASVILHKTDGHQIRLQNVTDSTTAVLGHSGYASSAGAYAMPPAEMYGRFTIASNKTFELQYRVATGTATNGLGAATGFGTEIYADLWIEKEAS